MLGDRRRQELAYQHDGGLARLLLRKQCPEIGVGGDDDRLLAGRVGHALVVAGPSSNGSVDMLGRVSCPGQIGAQLG